MNRDAQRLPLDIPEGDLDAGKRAEEGRSAVPEGVPVGLLPEMLDAGRIGSQQQRFEILDHPQDGVGLPSERCLAEPGQPIVGVDQHEDVVAPTRADRHRADARDPREFANPYPLVDRVGATPRRRYPLTAPPVRPCISCFWKRKEDDRYRHRPDGGGRHHLIPLGSELADERGDRHRDCPHLLADW